MTNIYKQIYKQIKQYDTIVIARHIGPDPDAIASQLGLRDSIRETFPEKKVYAIGNGVSKFKYYGLLDKLPEIDYSNSLLITTDVPGKGRIDGTSIELYKDVIKIDHHPFEERFGSLEIVDTNASSACELIIDLIYNTKLAITPKIAENLYMGVVSDSDRFLVRTTSAKTMSTVSKLLNDTKIDFVSLYQHLYERPLNEIRFQGYLSQNLKLTENGLGYVKITSDILKEYEVDSATPSNMINNFNFIKEVLVWTFITFDDKSGIYKINIRSRGPIINEVASKYNGGGHKFASGVRTTNKEDINKLLSDLDIVCKEYNESISE